MEISTKDLLNLTTQKSPFAGGAFGKLYKIEKNSEFAPVFNQTKDSVVKLHEYLLHGAKTLSEIKNKIEYLKARINSTFIQVDKIKRLMGLDLKYSTLPKDIIYVDGFPIGIIQNYVDGIDLINLGFKDMPTGKKKLIIDAIINGQIELLENYITKTDLINCGNVMLLNDKASEPPIQYVDFDDIATKLLNGLTSENYSDECKLALDNMDLMIKKYIEPDYEMPAAVYRNFKLKN